uniref:Uncharacterized protein n=1 Tax=Aureoumbra lagunensis TaxID=44058 RepID=A0A7S3K368_9STRA
MMDGERRLLRCVIVEQHHDVLPWLHLGMRRKVIATKGLSVVHFDAHPDLGALKNADVCFRPRELVQFLDESEYGISEWLLPLVYCGHVSRIVWVKPDFAKQIQNMTRIIRVGKCEERLAVDCDLDYFKDDGAYSAELEKAREFCLDVNTVVPTNLSTPYILDICLDYFACLNPFNGSDTCTIPLPIGGALLSQDSVDLTPLSTFLSKIKKENKQPQFITIARSATDGYTPNNLVDTIQTQVLTLLNDTFGKALCIHKDLGEDTRGPNDEDEIYFFSPSVNEQPRSTGSSLSLLRRKRKCES